MQILWHLSQGSLALSTLIDPLTNTTLFTSWLRKFVVNHL